MWRGTMGIPVTGALIASMFACGVFVVMTTVESSFAVTEAKFASSDPFEVPATLSVMMVVIVHATSSAVIGLPSDHVSPLCRVNVHVSLSGEEVHDFAR